MKTNIINIHGRWVVKTGKVLVYESDWLDEENTYSDEIIDVCTGIRYGFDGLIHKIGNPIDSFGDKKAQQPKRGRHSKSHNKTEWRKANPRWKRTINDELPF